ncbi:MAG: hypothetical protein MI807_16360 [Verrucomicrobiales bacterium]|nr:hypothetical protein [Verrucomicrobiales bacterium]
MEPNPSQDMPVWVVILIPFAFLIMFPLIWCFVMWINSMVSGWGLLVRRYRADEVPTGQVWNSVHGSVGLVSYRGVLTCVTNPEGIYIRPGMLFRFAHPGLFIPWSEFSRVRRRNILWLRMVAARVGDPRAGSLSLDAKVFEGSEGKNLLPQ